MNMCFVVLNFNHTTITCLQSSAQKSFSNVMIIISLKNIKTMHIKSYKYELRARTRPLYHTPFSVQIFFFLFDLRFVSFLNFCNELINVIKFVQY